MHENSVIDILMNLKIHIFFPSLIDINRMVGNAIPNE